MPITTASYQEKCKWSGCALPQGFWKRKANKARLWAKVVQAIGEDNARMFMNTEVEIEVCPKKLKWLKKYKQQYWS